MRIANIIHHLEQFASPHLQESWDNTGLQVGRRDVDCTGVLLCVDVTPDVVDEAIDKKCNFIVSHHPLLFKGIKKLTGANPVQKSIIKAVQAGITIYSSHTALDSCIGGVSYEMARRLGIEPQHTLQPIEGKLVNLRVYVPRTHADQVRYALYDAGAGAVGRYDCCSFTVEGAGTFRALEGAEPFVGEIGETHIEDEVAIDVVLSADCIAQVQKAIYDVHPYEEPAFVFTPTLNKQPKLGLGIVGNLDTPITATQLVANVKRAFGSPIVRTSEMIPSDIKIRRVALCGGSGGEFIPKAIANGATAYITSDVRYHDFVDYGKDIFIIDIGHFESEQCTKDIFYHIITEIFPNFAVYKSEIENNSINYQ